MMRVRASLNARDESVQVLCKLAKLKGLHGCPAQSDREAMNLHLACIHSSRVMVPRHTIATSAPRPLGTSLSTAIKPTKFFFLVLQRMSLYAPLSAYSSSFTCHDRSSSQQTAETRDSYASVHLSIFMLWIELPVQIAEGTAQLMAGSIFWQSFSSPTLL